MKFSLNLKKWAQALKSELLTLWFAYRDPRTPWVARLWAAMVVGYAFSPIDLIPDFIPVLGYLDDAVLLPAGVWLAIRLVPDEVLADSRKHAQQWFEQQRGKPRNWVAGTLILMLWLLLVGLLATWAIRRFR